MIRSLISGLRLNVKTRYAHCLILAGALGLSAPVALGANIQGKITFDGEMKAQGTSVVYIELAGGAQLEPQAGHVEIHQKRMTFIPHVIAITTGTTVDFWNDDSVSHGVSWPSIGGNKKLGHHLGAWAQGEMKSFTFNDAGVVPLLCYLHPEMSGFILVLPTPHFTVTDEDGSFVIRDVPSGEYMLKVWNEKGEPLAQPISVVDSVTGLALIVKRAHDR